MLLEQQLYNVIWKTCAFLAKQSPVLTLISRCFWPAIILLTGTPLSLSLYAHSEYLLTLLIFTYSLFFCLQAGSPINGYQKPPWGQEPGACTHLPFLFPPSANQKITTRCLCVWLALWKTSQSLSKKTWKNIPVKPYIHSFSSTIVHLSWKESALQIYDWIKHCTVCSCPRLAVTHAHRMCSESHISSNCPLPRPSNRPH